MPTPPNDNVCAPDASTGRLLPKMPQCRWIFTPARFHYVNERAISRIDSLDLRSVWPDEAHDFTPWIAEPENLALLGETLGLLLEPIGTELAVGSFSADVLCRSIGGGDEESWVVIENQYGKTNHDHLGKLLTYAAGLDAKTVVWIAEDFRDEHRAALDLLNDSTTRGFSYFGIEIELLKIDSSRPAPRFNVVVKPNDWSNTAKAISSGAKLGETARLQLEFWTSFQELMEAGSDIPVTKASPNAYMTHRIGTPGARVTSVFTSWNSKKESYSVGEIRVAFELFGPDRQQRFEAISQMSELIEADAGRKYLWQPWDSESILRVMVRRDADVTARHEWPNYQAWLKLEVERMFRAVVPKVLEV